MVVRHLRLFAAFTIGVCALAAPGADAEEALRVSGTGSALGALQRLAGPFASANPGLRLRILPSIGSGGAVSAVANGALEVGISGRPLSDAERALGLAAVLYGRTPLVIAVGPHTGATGITTAELARIYRGELTSWPNGERVRVVMRPPTDVDVALLRALSPELSAAIDAAYARQGLLVALTNQECDEILARTPGSIGPTSLGELTTVNWRLVPLAFDGVAPTLRNLGSGAYPLAKPLFAVTRAEPSPAVRRFLAFLAGPEAKAILEEAGTLAAPPAPTGGGDGHERR